MRILFVARADVIHAARWIDLVADEGWDLHLFAVEQRPLNSELRNVTVHTLLRQPALVGQGGQVAAAALGPGVRQTAILRWPLARGATRFEQALERATRGRTGYPRRLARLIKSLRPDIIHAMEMQKAGYMLHEASLRLGARRLPATIYSSWGSDIYYFGRLPDHAGRIRSALTLFDYHIADCARDVGLASQFGFAGKSLGVLPGGGGLDVARIQALRRPGPTSARRVIALKGYHDDLWVGRALVGLQGILLSAEALKGFEVVIYSAGPNVAREAESVERATGLRVSVMPPSPHESVLRLMGRARAAIGLSTSDGTPNAMLEAMAMGAFPIQSDVGSTGEWLQNGVNGAPVRAEDARAVADALRLCVGDDALVDRAAEINFRLTLERIDRAGVKRRALECYQRVYADHRPD